MPNLWYQHTTYPAPNSQGSSSGMRAELDAISAGFDLLPPPLGVGRQGFSGGRFEDPQVVGGTLDDVDIGLVTPGKGSFTTLTSGNTSNTFTKTGGVTIDGSPGSNRVQTYASSGLARFLEYIGSEAETGSNTGSAFHLDAAMDDGVTVANVYSIVRATQIMTFAKRPVFGTATPWDSGNLVDPVTLSGAQNITGNKTFTGGITTTTGNVVIGQGVATAAIELGGGATSQSFLDFHSVGGSGNDYDGRIIASGGVAGTVGKATMNYLAGSHWFTGDLNMQSAGTFSYALYLRAGSFSPFIRGVNDGTVQFINSANTASNLSISDNGNVTVRSVLFSSGINNTGGLNQNGTLTMQNYNQIALSGPAYTGFLRADAGGLVGFINQAGNNWTLQIWNDGHIVAGGNIQAFSDETLKKNWKPLAPDIIDQIATIQKSGTYERNDIIGRHVGIGAQSLQRFMPEAVSTNEVTGKLAVNYGGAALALCVELCREVKDMRSRLAHLEDAT